MDQPQGQEKVDKPEVVLPDAVVIKIWSYLKRVDIKQHQLVCKRWKRIYQKLQFRCLTTGLPKVGIPGHEDCPNGWCRLDPYAAWEFSLGWD